ncbi:MAG: DUF922 domain-containing protein [Bacteroidia bacterium]
MNKFFCTTLIALCFWGIKPLSICAQGKDSTLITWSDSYKLNYDDFMGKPGKEAEVALTSSGIYFLYEYDGKSQLSIQLSSMFDKTKSWFKEDGKVPEVLSHEQTHFDITELNVRLFRKALTERSFRKANNFDVLLPRIYNDFTGKCSQMQNDYDNQTNHGTDTNAQKGWEKKVAKQLEELKQYNAVEMLFKVN